MSIAPDELVVPPKKQFVNKMTRLEILYECNIPKPVMIDQCCEKNEMTFDNTKSTVFD